jgi:HlyD family secretion protein
LKKSTKIWLTVVVLAVGGIGFQAKKANDEKQSAEVEIKRVERKDLRSIVSASGKIKPKTMVDVSAAVSGKVLELFVHEGDHVEKGQRLFKIDPTPFEAQVQQFEASIDAAKANVELQKAQVAQSESSVRRSEGLAKDGLVTVDELDRERTTVAVERARLKATEQELPRLQANLDEAKHELTKVDVLSDIAGTVTAVNIEAGEYAFVGAFNNPATVLLTVADLDVIEAEIEVDESQAIRSQVGQKAEVEVDAHPDWLFQGVVTEVGHKPVTKLTGAEREGTSYLVKVLVEDRIPGVRPGLTCSARIRTDERKGAVALPIQALVMRKPMTESTYRRDATVVVHGPDVAVAAEGPPPADPKQQAAPTSPRNAEHLVGSNATRRKDEEGKIEGCFYVRDGKAWFRAVTIGITGEKDFEVLSGLDEGMEIVVGPYKALHTLKEGDRVRPAQKKDDEKKS